MRLFSLLTGALVALVMCGLFLAMKRLRQYWRRAYLWGNPDVKSAIARVVIGLLLGVIAVIVGEHYLLSPQPTPSPAIVIDSPPPATAIQEKAEFTIFSLNILNTREEIPDQRLCAHLEDHIALKFMTNGQVMLSFPLRGKPVISPGISEETVHLWEPFAQAIQAMVADLCQATGYVFRYPEPSVLPYD